MSPKAVKERLLTLNELWLLSVKLMNSKKIKSAEKDRTEKRAEEADSAEKAIN